MFFSTFKTTTEVKINFLNDVTKYGHTCDKQRPVEGSLNKSSSLTGTEGVIKFTTINVISLVTPCCAP